MLWASLFIYNFRPPLFSCVQLCGMFMFVANHVAPLLGAFLFAGVALAPQQSSPFVAPPRLVCRNDTSRAPPCLTPSKLLLEAFSKRASSVSKISLTLNPSWKDTEYVLCSDDFDFSRANYWKKKKLRRTVTYMS